MREVGVRWQLILLLLSLCFCLDAQERTEIIPQEISFIPQGGFYEKGLSVEMKHELPRARIYYTLDGSLPDSTDLRYENKFRITGRQNTVVRAIAYYDGKASRVEASTYLFNEPKTDWPVITMTIDPEMLFDTISGIFELGVNNELNGLANYGANYWTRKEHFMNLEIFEKDSTCVYRSPCGFRLFGGMSRTFPQKSIAVSSRIRYGDKRFRHRFFKDTKIRRFKHLIFRNAGSDWNRAHGRDAVINSMVDDWGLDKQAYQPCHAYINGEYWGIYYIREKINTYFLASHHRHVDPDTIDLIEHRWALRKGSRKSYTNMLEFIETQDISNKQNYDYLKTQMNVENYADYKLLEIFIDNSDAGGNIKFWRADTYDDGRWNWILYDTDWGFGLMKNDAYYHNSLDFHTEADGPDWPNPPWSTLILRKLLDNKEFERLFLNRFCDRLNTSFRTDSMLSKIETHYNLMQPEMQRQFERWNSSRRVWDIHYNRMIAFSEKRPEIMWGHLMQRFNTGKRIPVNFSAEGRGRVLVNNNLKVTYKKPMSGEYFEKIPITLHAQPRLGYTFSHWEGIDQQSPIIKISLREKENLNVKAVFVPLETELMDSIIFNEVSIFNKQTSDWMEIMNLTDSNINLGGWIVKNKKKEFRLPSRMLAPKDYVILAKDTSRFLSVFPEYKDKVIGNFNFGLDKSKDKLELFTRKGATVDTFAYHISTPNSDFTLDLVSPYADNADSSNWEITYGRGTPGGINPTYLFHLTKEQKLFWLTVGLFIGIGMVFFIVMRSRS